MSASGDDFGFMDAMKANVEKYQCVEPSHVFATGFSMGGYVAEQGDGGAGQCYVYDGCPSGGQVELCTFNGMSHCWAGGSGAGGPGGSCSGYPSATELEWAFFEKYAW